MIPSLWARWEEQLFSELPGLADRLPLLSAPYRALIEELQKEGKLPARISDDLLAALHELASDLQPIDLNLSELARALLSEGSALTVANLRSALDAYLAELLKGYNQDLARIKIVFADNEEQ